MTINFVFSTTTRRTWRRKKYLNLGKENTAHIMIQPIVCFEFASLARNRILQVPVAQPETFRNGFSIVWKEPRISARWVIRALFLGYATTIRRFCEKKNKVIGTIEIFSGNQENGFEVLVTLLSLRLEDRSDIYKTRIKELYPDCKT